MPVSAEVMSVMGRMGVKGVSRVRARVLDGDDKDKLVTRNVVGPIRAGDIILLKDTSLDSVARLNK